VLSGREAGSSGDRGVITASVKEIARARLARDLPLIVGILTFALVWVGHTPPAGTPPDFDYLWIAARGIWDGNGPYAAVRQAVDQGFLPFPFSYPATAAVVVTPLGVLPYRVSVALFTALGMALLAWSVRKDRPWRRWIVVSAPAVQALLLGQWSPWLTAAVGLPWLGFVWAAKPTIGLALAAGWPSRQALYGCLALLVLSFILVPHWPAEWREALRSTPQYVAPVQRFGGALLLLAFLRWRHPEARMLGTMALVPHVSGLYEQLPLLLIPQSGRAFAVLMGLEYLATFLVYTLLPHGQSNVAAMLDAQWPCFFALVYIPALVMVLRARRPAAPQHSRDHPPRIAPVS
jgi:hypothetical protein